MKIREIATKEHFTQRLQERADNLILNLPFELPQVEGLTKEEIDSALKNEIIKKVRENTYNALSGEFEGNGAIIVARISLIYKDKIYKPEIVARSSDKSGETKEKTGNTYMIAIKGSVATSLMITDAESEAGVKNQTASHLSRNLKEKIDPSSITVLESPNSKITISVENVIMGLKNKGLQDNTPDKEELDYEPRTDYRKDAIFKHKKYGAGKIVNTSNGTKGTGDMNGRLDWVDVEVAPYMKGGKFEKIRRFERIYTIPGLEKIKQKTVMKQESIKKEIKLLESLTGKKVNLKENSSPNYMF